MVFLQVLAFVLSKVCCSLQLFLCASADPVTPRSPTGSLEAQADEISAKGCIGYS